MERLIKYFVPELYNLVLRVDKHQKTIGGIVEVKGKATSNVVKFHAVNLDIEYVKIDDKKTDFDYRDGLLTLTEAVPGDLAIEVGYHGTLNENMQGAYLSSYQYEGKEERIVATQFESHYAREAFPCIDEPAAKAIFNLVLITPQKDSEDLILANTEQIPITNGKTEEIPSNNNQKNANKSAKEWSSCGKLVENLWKSCGKGVEKEWKTTFFAPTPRMSTYLLAFVIGRFKGKTVKNASGTQITTYATLAQEDNTVDSANEVAAKSLEFYEKNFKAAYPLEKLDQVALPDFEAGAMENWGLVTYRESMLLVSENASLDHKKIVALTVAHELSHQWFGDLVTMEWWDDLWLNESFASIMEYYAVDSIHPEFKIFEDFFTGDCLLALENDGYEGVQSVHQEVENPAEIATLFDPAIVYCKGAHIMLMLIRAMGWENFVKGLKDYFEKHAYQNTVGDDLWNALTPYAPGFDPKKLIHAFIDRPGYPVFTKEAQAATKEDNSAASLNGGNLATVTKNGSQVSAQNGNKEAQEQNNGYSQHRFLFDAKMPKSDWPVPEVKDDMSGHYIINLSDAEFAEKLENFKELSLEQKIRLLIDRILITKTDLAPTASLISLLSKFKHEESSTIWGLVLYAVSNLKIFFAPDSEEETKFRQFVGELVREKMDEVGVVPEEAEAEKMPKMTDKEIASDTREATEGNKATKNAKTTKNSEATKGSEESSETIRLRNTLLSLDFYARTPETLEKLASLYDEDYTKISAEMRDFVLCSKIYLEPEIYGEMLKKYQMTADPAIKNDIIGALTFSRDEENVIKTIDILGKYDIVKPQDQLSLFIRLYRNPSAKERTWDYMVKDWAKISKMAGDKSLDNYPHYLANFMRTEEEKKKYRDFFEPKESDPAISRAIKVGKKRIDATLKLIAEDGEGVIKAIED